MLAGVSGLHALHRPRRYTAVLGLAAGVRPSTLLFLGPLFLFSLWRAPRNMTWVGIGTLAATLLAWFVPMLYASGGPAAYFKALTFLWESSPGKQNVISQLLLLSLVRFSTVAGLFVLCFGSAVLLFARTLANKTAEHLSGANLRGSGHSRMGVDGARRVVFHLRLFPIHQ